MLDNVAMGAPILRTGQSTGSQVKLQPAHPLASDLLLKKHSPYASLKKGE
jgi:hypothetical protein